MRIVRNLFTGLFLLMLLALMPLTACNNSNHKNKIVVGMECSYQPFNFTQTKKTDTNVEISNVPGAYAEGYDVQIAKMIAKELDLELEIRAIEWDGLVPALQSKQIDLIIAGMSKTEKRLETIDFTSHYYQSEEVVLVKADGKYKDATTLADFQGARVVGQLGTIYADLVPQMVNKGAVAGTNLASVPEIVNAIANNTVDATILELPVANGVVASNPSLKVVSLTDGFVVSDEDVKVSIGVRKKYSLTTRINEILDGISEETRNRLMQEAVMNSGA